MKLPSCHPGLQVSDGFLFHLKQSLDIPPLTPPFLSRPTQNPTELLLEVQRPRWLPPLYLWAFALVVLYPESPFPRFSQGQFLPKLLGHSSKVTFLRAAPSRCHGVSPRVSTVGLFTEATSSVGMSPCDLSAFALSTVPGLTGAQHRGDWNALWAVQALGFKFRMRDAYRVPRSQSSSGFLQQTTGPSSQGPFPSPGACGV